MKDKSDAPAGAYVELDIDLIDEGRLKEQVESKLKQSIRDLLDYEKKTMDTQGSAVVTVKIKMTRTKGSSEFFDVEYTSASQVPNVVRGTSVREAGGKLLCQPSGSSTDCPDQQLFYDRTGRIIGGTDPETGEVHEQAVAGTIGRRAVQA